MPFFFFRKKETIRDSKETKKATAVSAKKNNVKVGLTLGGGGARGFAHIGVLKAFEEEGIQFDMVSGTSVGSVVGAAYCFGLKSEELINIAHNLQIRDIRNRNTILMQSDPNNIGNVIKQTMGDITFESLPRPLYVVAVDLKSSSEIIIERGSIANAVSASCAVPLVFRPVAKGQYHLVDGGVLNNIPSDVLRVRGADKVVAVDINSSRNEGTESLKLFDVASATFRIMMANSSVKGLLQSDIIIRPDTKRFSASKKDGYAEMIEEGYRAAKNLMPKIKELFGGINQ